MLLCTYVIPSQVAMFREFLEPSASEFDLVVRYGDESGDQYDDRNSPAFKTSARRRMAFVLETMRANPGETILHTDVDVIFCGPARQRIEDIVSGLDVVAMRASVRMNVGFMALRSTPTALELMETIVADPGGFIARDEVADEMALNVYAKRMARWGFLPQSEYWNLGFIYRDTRDLSDIGCIAVPPEVRVFHACFCRGMEAKLWLLNRVRELLDQPAPRLLVPLSPAE